MYVTTFYSYKGGVGRTMALINTAFLLAQQKKRVLIVDFDLEAPGLPSFDMFRSAGSRPGLVDYVCAYRDSHVAPDVADFIVQCENGDGTPIWLMPAGRHTQAGYAEKLYSIDWKDLYDNHAGFLMFEDLRYQWSQHAAAFDYVLIDSRTGHTDVGGICTRQLPNSVVVMFLPNEQNIEGLRPIVQSIRAEDAAVRGQKIALHFCPSNVPDLDDEHHILSDMLATAKSTLGYDTAASTLLHYNSMDLLTQPAFAVSRPNSKLSGQYHQLVEAIVSLNYDDVMGAELALQRMPRRYENARRAGKQGELLEIEAAASKIAALQPESGVIGWLLSILYGRMGALEEELEALTLAIEQGYERNRAIVRRARVLSSLDKKDAAVADLRALLGSGTATVFDILASIDLLRAMTPKEWIGPVQNAIDQLQADPAAYLALVPSLMSDRERLPLAVNLARRLLKKGVSDANERLSVRSWLILSLIGLGNFELAMEAIAEDGDDPSKMRMTDLFNYAIAEWGAAGRPHRPFFELVLQRIVESRVTPDANLFQCRALAELVLGQRDAALASLDKARSRARTGVLVFSCWRYLEVSSSAMIEDLSAMTRAVGDDSALQPAFFDEVRRLVS